jgi:CheY-like chemotaxis protein
MKGAYNMADTPQKRVLIIEDEKPLARILQAKLEKEGYEVIVGHNGQTCLDLVSEGHFNVLLLDLMMPVMDGFQVLEKLKSLPERPVTFVLSNLGQAEDEHKTMELGAQRYFIKSNTQLATIVDAVKQVAPLS